MQDQVIQLEADFMEIITILINQTMDTGQHLEVRDCQEILIFQIITMVALDQAVDSEDLDF